MNAIKYSPPCPPRFISMVAGLVSVSTHATSVVILSNETSER